MLISDHGVILAAGYGKRLRPATLDCPKPLLQCGKKPLIEWSIEKLRAFGIKHITINTHYLHEQMEAHFKNTPDVTLLYEQNLLETGGTVSKIIAEDPLCFSNKPFFVLNGDNIWHDKGVPLLDSLAKTFTPSMQALLAVSRHDRGDFDFDENSKELIRGSALRFMGVQILHQSLFNQDLPPYFSLNRIYHDSAIKKTLFGFEYHGFWHHVGTVEEKKQAEIFLKNQPYES